MSYWVRTALTLKFPVREFTRGCLFVGRFFVAGSRLHVDHILGLIEEVFLCILCCEFHPINPTPWNPSEHNMAEIMTVNSVLRRRIGKITVPAEVEIYVMISLHMISIYEVNVYGPRQSEQCKERSILLLELHLSQTHLNDTSQARLDKELKLKYSR